MDLDVVIDPASADCAADTTGIAYRPAADRSPRVADKHDFERAYDEGFFERMGYKVEPSLMAKQWASLTRLSHGRSAASHGRESALDVEHVDAAHRSRTGG